MKTITLNNAKTHNQLFRLGKKVDAFLLFRKETGSNFSFEKYVKNMILFHN